MGPLGAGRRHSVLRRPDGSVVACGNTAAGECDVRAWTGIVSVAAGNVHAARNTGRSHTVALRSDGTVVATGWNGDGQLDVDDWTEIVAVAAGWRTTLGLRADETVVAAGRRTEGQLDVDAWRRVAGISCGDWHSVAVLSDGTAVAVGNNTRGQCDVAGWQNLRAVSAGYLHTVGLRWDGRVVATGDGRSGACDTGEWSEIAAVSAGSGHTVALRRDGRVCAVGDNGSGQCETGAWTGVTAIAAGAAHTLGLRADGTVLTAGADDHGQCTFPTTGPDRFETVRAAYGTRAQEYITLVGGLRHLAAEDVALVLKWAADIDGTVLDIGCGPGQWTNLLNDSGHRAQGIDPVPEFVDHARTAYPDSLFTVGRAESTGAAEGSFGGVLAWYSLIHTEPEHIGSALREFHRILRPGGGLALGFFEGERLEPFDHAVTSAWFWPMDLLVHRVETAGFRITHTEARADSGVRRHGAIIAVRTAAE